MKLLLLVIFGLSFKTICSNVEPCFPDYYWRDFRGKIPPDAVEGGRTASQRPFYVAQAYVINKEISPAMVFVNKSEVLTIPSGGVTMKTNTHVRVLCSKHRENLKWIPVKSEDLHKLVNVHFVVGGSEIGQVMYIGRVSDEFSTTIGKIYKHNHRFRGLWVPSQGTQANYLSYEILVYSCDDDKSMPIDFQ